MLNEWIENKIMKNNHKFKVLKLCQDSQIHRKAKVEKELLIIVTKGKRVLVKDVNLNQEALAEKENQSKP